MTKDYNIIGLNVFLVSITLILGFYSYREYNIVKELGLIPKYFSLYITLISIIGIVCVWLIYLLLEKISQNRIDGFA